MPSCIFPVPARLAEGASCNKEGSIKMNRSVKIIMSGIGIGASAIIITGCSSGSSVATSPAHSAPASQETLTSWAAGPGYDKMMKVSADDFKLSKDGSNLDLAAVSADGTQLAIDARASATDAPPANAPGNTRGHFVAAMTYEAAAGDAYSVGSIDEGNVQLNNAVKELDKATSAISG